MTTITEEATGAVRVRKLEWIAGPSYSGVSSAQTVLGEYQVWDINGGVWRGPGEQLGILTHGTLDDAKAAAQAHYEARIRSALVAPQAEGRDTGLIAAAQKVYDKLASETGTVTILDQEALGDALRALSPKEPE